MFNCGLNAECNILAGNEQTSRLDNYKIWNMLHNVFYKSSSFKNITIVKCSILNFGCICPTLWKYNIYSLEIKTIYKKSFFSNQKHDFIVCSTESAQVSLIALTKWSQHINIFCESRVNHGRIVSSYLYALESLNKLVILYWSLSILT